MTCAIRHLAYWIEDLYTTLPNSLRDSFGQVEFDKREISEKSPRK